MSELRVWMGQHYVDGIRRVVDALRLHLPQHGIQVVDHEQDADLLAVHGAEHAPSLDLPLVAHCHGLMWSEYPWPPGMYADAINARVIATMVQSQAITAPSAWVARAITRGMLRPVQTILHGVNPEEWTPPATHAGYVLWNKARADLISDPHPVGAMATRMPEQRFVATIAPPADNIHIVGPQSPSAMRSLVAHAGVYLATTRETFGIGTLEALSSGVPVVGYRYGGQEEIVVEGETGHLVRFEGDGTPKNEPRDPEVYARDLAAAIDDVASDAERARRWGDAGRRRVVEHFSWSAIAERTALLYRSLVQQKR